MRAAAFIDGRMVYEQPFPTQLEDAFCSTCQTVVTWVSGKGAAPAAATRRLAREHAGANPGHVVAMSGRRMVYVSTDTEALR